MVKIIIDNAQSLHANISVTTDEGVVIASEKLSELPEMDNVLIFAGDLKDNTYKSDLKMVINQEYKKNAKKLDGKKPLPKVEEPESVKKCKECGQIPGEQTGEYPCKVCGEPILHDESIEKNGGIKWQEK